MSLAIAHYLAKPLLDALQKILPEHLRPGQVIQYVITDADNRVPNDRVRAYAVWEGWHGYDRKKYREMLLEAVEPFERPLRQLEFNWVAVRA